MLLGVDVGGTFTDAVLVDGERVHTAKSPTTADQSEGVLAAVETVLAAAGASAADVTRFAHGMTVGTNALLERRGARTALVATAGFTDVLEIARQDRPFLYRLERDRPPPLSPPDLRVAVHERIDPGGIVEELTDAEVDRVVAEVAGLDPEAVAICLLHSYLDPSHERRLATAIRGALPTVHVSVSSEILPRFREYERCSTTVLDAYLSPLLAGYLARLSRRCADVGLPEPLVMRSSGGVVDAGSASRAGAWSVLSGPAGGAVGAAIVASSAAGGDAIGLDMGGTSCDVCVVTDGAVGRSEGRELEGRPIQLPMVDVHTVGAGGGSVAWRDDGGALRVGPRSAGAEPGPACYGRGGTDPTVTDANLLLGHLDPERGLAGGVDLDQDAAAAAVGRLADSLGLDPIETAEGIVEVANQEMVRALRVVTVERGIDPRELSLLPFGGAGALHAAAIADELGIDRIVCPRTGGVLSALGLVRSERRRDTTRTVMLAGDRLNGDSIAAAVAATVALIDPPQDATIDVLYGIRYRGKSFELQVPGPPDPDPNELAEAFAAEHERRYGYREPTASVELVDIGVAAREPAGEGGIGSAPGGFPERATRMVRFEGGWTESSVSRGLPGPGTVVDGPALIEAEETTLVLPPGWRAEVDEHGTIVAERRRRSRSRAPTSGPGTAARSPGPIELQVLSGALRAVCDEMGAVLIRSAHSANIKERRDCSTAIFDRDAELVMQAEHIPVHLGSMPFAVAAVAAAAGAPAEGETWILNDPFAGGTHLPDVTLVSPLLAGGEHVGWAASRAHHADIGGPTPGGMPAGSRRLADEGIVISPRRVDDEALAELAGRMRRPDERLADLRAQRAANSIGARRIGELAARLGSDRLVAGMAAVLDHAERRSRAAIARLPDGVHVADDSLEAADGSAIPVHVAVSVSGEEIEADFSGSSPQVEGNLNCPLSVTSAAVMFAIRTLTDPDAPPSAGAFRPVRILAPVGSLLNARPGAAVVAGNVETSSRVADLVMAALAGPADGPAQGQGTMNNLTLAGRDRHGTEITYYETIGGGQGASRGGDGPSAVHVAMSNTLNTPVEALEADMPVRVREVAVRRGSGGAGRRRGGDGVVRSIEALAPLRYSLITERRSTAPAGREGGAPGLPGRNLLDGEPLPAKCEGMLAPGSVLRIETPGGGGFGTRVGPG